MFVGCVHVNWGVSGKFDRQGASEQIMEGFNLIKQGKQDEGKEER